MPPAGSPPSCLHPLARYCLTARWLPPVPACHLYLPAPRPTCNLPLVPARRELKMKLEEDRKRLVEAINTTFGNLVRRRQRRRAGRLGVPAAVGALDWQRCLGVVLQLWSGAAAMQQCSAPLLRGWGAR